MSLFHLFICACFYCIAPIQYGILRSESRPKKNIVLGATLPFEAREGAEVAAVAARFRRQETAVLVILTIAALPALLFPLISQMLIYMGVWLIAAVAVPYLPYVQANRALKELKRARGWRRTVPADTVVDLAAAAQPKKGLPLWQLLLPAAISAVPMVYMLLQGRSSVDFWGVMLGCGCVTVTIALLAVLYRLIFRQRSDVVDDNAERTAALTRVRRQGWGRMLLWTSWLTAGLNLCLWLTVSNVTALLIATFAYIAALLAACLYTELKVRDLQARLTAQSGREELVDEDRYWLGGILYCNPNDRHLMINQRVGSSMTVNAGRPAGKVLLALSAVALLILPFLGVWFMSEETTPVTLSVTEQTIVVEHTRTAYEVPLDSIVSAELLDTLPPCSRQVGTGMDTLLKGRFALEGGVTAQLCLNPQVPPFLKLETGEGAIYLFGAQDSAQTRAVYDALHFPRP